MTDPSSRRATLYATERVLRDRLINLPRRAKQALMLASDMVGFSLCVGLAAWVQLISPLGFGDFALLVSCTLVVALALARYLGFYHSIVRYLGMGLLMAGAKVAAGSALALACFAWLANMTTEPVRLAVVYGAFCGLYLVGSRYLAQYVLVRRSPDKDKVIVFGAGQAGVRVVNAMQASTRFHPVALIDDEPRMQDKQVLGLSVHARSALPRLIGKYNVSRILLAVPSASRRARQEIIEDLEPLGVHVQTVPDFVDLISGKARVDDIREVDVEDLLSREPVAADDALMQATLKDKSVLVTGAGGSIGSELCRQMLGEGPKRLVLVENSERALYDVNRELVALAGKFEISSEVVPLLGCVLDGARMREIMHFFDIDTVYHAAAYKHVPIVEQNILEGVANNVLGTLRTAEAARDEGVETFVLVSTDKAVSPTSVMGASKRLAELVLQAMQPGSAATRFAMVRFGNVLESSGSVVPLFREQIRNGGPVTVTHPEVIRYFMTIPEAAQLVIQAGGMAEGGEVFVLDMGQPVRIRDLAVRMIRLMGLTVRDDRHPNGDIEVAFTGLRPAEKLYEELLIGKNATGTSHPRILRAREAYLASQDLEPLLDELEGAAARRDRAAVRDILKRAVHEYEPHNGIDDLVWEGPQEEPAKTGRKVVSFKPG